MNWLAAGGVAVLSAAAGASGQFVLVPDEHVRVSPWSGGGAVASPGGVIYGELGEGKREAFYQHGEPLCDDITTTLEFPGLLALLDFTIMVEPGHGGGEFDCEVRLVHDKGGLPDADQAFAGFDIMNLGLDEGGWIITMDLVGVVDIWLPPGRFWWSVRFTGDEQAVFVGQMVGGVPGVGSSEDLLYLPSKGLFDFGGEPKANVGLQLTANEAGCYPDCAADGAVDLFDFLCFQNSFVAQSEYADCDGNGAFELFDFLCFQNAFIAGC